MQPVAISRLSHASLFSRVMRSSERRRSRLRSGRIHVYRLLTVCKSGEISIKQITVFSGRISQVSKSSYFDILLSLASQAIKYSGLGLKKDFKKFKD